MRLTLNYLYPPYMTEATRSTINTDMPTFNEWIDFMVKDNPSAIFFFTVETTDIWEEEEPEIDYNTIVSMADNVVLTHTYSPKCPEGCYGQLDDCSFKTENEASLCSCPGAPYHKDDCPLRKR